MTFLDLDDRSAISWRMIGEKMMENVKKILLQLAKALLVLAINVQFDVFLTGIRLSIIGCFFDGVGALVASFVFTVILWIEKIVCVVVVANYRRFDEKSKLTKFLWRPLALVAAIVPLKILFFILINVAIEAGQ